MPVLKHNSLLEEGCYRPIKIRIPASSARIPMTLFGITKRTIKGSPCKINQTASNIIPTDMLSLLFLIGRDKRDRLFFLARIFSSVGISISSRYSRSFFFTLRTEHGHLDRIVGGDVTLAT